ncbi:glycosyltransferase [Methanobrevibacter sp.]|uniref:glycosyltransferase family 2 protein n=1 Tax=Methanobrevibacter sp. TaxID=66852 RepID=UPI0025CEB766|nr:glycosyltransferase [Methanobrevibacter sp.]MBQ2666054.1 glycosyltransferase [Methanobrevibacter sp.]
MVKISVIVPVYNVSEYLEDALSGLLNQTFHDFEAICVNDGSKDNSLEILNEFAKKDSRIKVIDKENGGCGSARNRALDAASGEYIYFFDPDDYIAPNAFEELYENITSNDSDLVIFKIAWFMEGEPVNYKKPMFNFDEIFTDVDFNNFTFTFRDVKRYVLNVAFAPWSKLYRKEFLDKYDDFRFDLGVAFDDVPFHVKSMLRATKISFAPDFYYHYRYANPNSVNNTSSNGIDIMKIVDIVEGFLKSEGYFDELEKEFYEFKVRQIFMYMLSSHSEEYFRLAQEKLLEVKEFDVPEDLIQRYYWAINANSFKEYELNVKVDGYQKRVNKLSKENKSLKKEIKKNKKINDELLSSKSWKITKPLRKMNIFK